MDQQVSGCVAVLVDDGVLDVYEGERTWFSDMLYEIDPAAATDRLWRGGWKVTGDWVQRGSRWTAPVERV